MGGNVVNTQYTKSGVHQKTAQLLRRLVTLELQQAIDKANRKPQIIKKVADDISEYPRGEKIVSLCCRSYNDHVQLVIDNIKDAV